MLRARSEHAVPALELRAVHREIRVMQQLVRILAVVREAGDAHRDGHPDRLVGRFDVEPLLGDRAADALGNLERLIEAGLREQDREFLSAEARGDVVVAKLGAEDLGDALEHLVADEMAVRVVDLAQQVEVGDDQRRRPLEALRARQLVRQHDREMPCVEEAGLRVDARLLLEPGHVQRPVDEQ